MLPNKSYGIDHSLPNSNFHCQLHQLHFQTTNWQSWSPIILSSMHAPNILSIDIALHFLWDHVNKGTINMFCIKTDYNIANISTKALTWPVHQNFTYELGIIPVKGECWDSDRHTPACTGIVCFAYYCILSIYCLPSNIK